VFCYRALAGHLGENQPFFGLRPPGLDAERRPLTTVPELASYFAAQIQTVHKSGPCIIAGYCVGGTIAFGLAQQLAQVGVPVRFVALFAGRYPTWFRTFGQLRHRAALCADRLAFHAGALARRSLPERCRYVAEILGRLTTMTPNPHAAASEPASPNVPTVQRATMKGVCSYAPGHFDGRLILILPSAKARRPSDGLLRWSRHARRVDERCGPDGCEGDTMLLEPHVAAIARLFERCCDEHRLA
jgi:thioesterase domain-containing protein